MEFIQPISKELFTVKYMLHEESTIKEVFEGVSEEIASPEKDNKKWKNIFYTEMDSGRFIPGGRIVANARPYSKMKNYNNCYVISIGDSMEDIYTALREDALIGKMGGGVGFNISSLRPKSAPISKGGTSSGPLSFLEVFDVSAEAIHTGGGRRGAHIVIMDCDHPDIEEFVTYKQGEKNKKLQNFNISVGVTDAFMQAVMENTTWDLVFNGEVYKTIQAVYLYDLIMTNMYEHNEPGIFFLDEVQRNNTGVSLYDINSCNPCFTGDMQLLTDRGYKSFEELFEKRKASIINKNGEVVHNCDIWCSGEKETIKLSLRNHPPIVCTPDHLFYVEDEWVEARNTLNKRLTPYTEEAPVSYSFEEQVGFIQGDGCLGRLKSPEHVGIEVNIGKNDDDILPLFAVERTRKEEKRFYLTGFKEKLIKFGFSSEQLPNRDLPIEYLFSLSKDKLSMFLRGLYSANGCVIQGYRVAFKSTCKKLIEQLGVVLQKEFGIDTYMTTNKATKVSFSNGEYLCKESYDLNITRSASLAIFSKEINFIQKYKRRKLKELIYKRAPKVTSIKPNGIQKVYDFNEKTTNAGWVNGALVHNCGEQPLPPYGCCCLGSLNITTFVTDPFTEQATFDTRLFETSVAHAVRFLDNVLDMSDYPLEHIKQQVLGERRIGLGFTGFADAQAMLGIMYGSEDSKKFSHIIGELLRNASYNASIDLAIEKGTFPFWNKDMANDGFLKTLPQGIKERISTHGLRNIALNTIAPTGTTSLTLGNNCSSGLEPMFSLEYDRTVRQEDSTTRKEKVMDYAWAMYTQIYGDTVEKPPYFVTTFDVDPYDAIEVQGILQKYIDASISKTANLPNHFSFSNFKNLFIFAWEHKLKGFTSFNPNGSMAGILSTGRKEDIERHAPKRPKELPCDIYEMVVNKQRIIALVGLHEQKPYEVFLTDDPDGIISVKGAKEGKILKVKSGRYDLVIEGKRGTYTLRDITSVFDDEFVSLGRMVSMALRHQISLPFIVAQLNKQKQFGTFSKGMARVLKKYITDAVSGEKCPECGEELKYVEGCKACACGWSKCE